MDIDVFLKAVISATILLGILLWLRNVYYSCVLTSSGWGAIKKISEDVGFNPKTKVTAYEVFRWLVYWPIVIPAFIHGKGKAAAKIENNRIVICWPGNLCGDPEFCAEVAGESIAEAMSEKSDDYHFQVTSYEYDEKEDAIFCSIRRKQKEVTDA